VTFEVWPLTLYYTVRDVLCCPVKFCCCCEFQNHISCARIQTFHELSQSMYLGERPCYSECVGTKPTFLAQALSILRIFKFVFIWDSCDFYTIYRTIYSGYTLKLIFYLIKHSFKHAQLLVSSFLSKLRHFKMCQNPIFRYHGCCLFL
jgi:hypothetical protein